MTEGRPAVTMVGAGPKRAAGTDDEERRERL